MWVSLPSVLMIAIFPVTVMYLVLAPQVLELRLVIREGLLQAFARRAVSAVRSVVLALTVAALFLLARQSPHNA